ncbi:GNAT family N-acetyltransferase [Qipengyuania sp. 1NDH17]|uniref:GNAT family N-acetyltransferase n=2 Tax=Qipengyuania polymorpha TaxID=2867234 RepID=A0ABS7IW82_9SPHN|nr:GNAT family N-acetyltransferase [Qipengyuania polymorpha]MBX7457773.1 GNAT family N-acetyltransferase [Qipengyuania polymorpha]
MDVMEASFDPHYREAWTRRQVEDSLALPSTYMLLVGEDGTPPAEGVDAAGFALARQALDEIELLLIAVRPELRGKGLGRALLRQFFDSARERAAVKVFLEMRANNSAEKLYRAEGFTQIGQRRDYYRTITGHSLDALTFAREV